MIYAADLFCGAGGTSTGLVRALKKRGYQTEDINLLAINHWKVAIATHTANHPWAQHMDSNLDNIDPRKVVPGGYLDLMVASPECTHHSRARGGKPKSDQSRASAWNVIRWCEAVNIQNVLIENVPEFRDWGPLYEDCNCGVGIDSDIKQHSKKCHWQTPILKLKGRIYRAFLSSLRAMGYNVSDRVINCADFGDPTTRKRLFILARKGKKVHWPEPTHHKTGGADLFGKRQTWKPARDVIDWTIPGKSIFDRKKALSVNTMRRIMRGLEKYSGLPFVIGQQSAAAPRSVSDPVPTVAGAGAISLVQPYLVSMYGQSNAGSIEEPVPTVTAQGQHLYLVEPYIVKLFGTSNAAPINEPLPTVVSSGNHLYLAEPFIVACNHGKDENRSYSVDQPLPAVTSVDAWGMVQPFLVSYHGASYEGGERVCSVDNPMPTVATNNQFGLVEPFIVQYYGTGQAKSVNEPLDTITGKDRFGLVLPLQDGSKAIVDIRFRMLQPHELSAAMSFPKDYKFFGNRSEKVKQIGNAVPGKTAEALINTLLS
jgi:DNA (cytosine-5)-methyltransferase 1